MKWFEPKIGLERIRKTFLLIPLTLDGEKGRETRWLEVAKVKEVYRRDYACQGWCPEAFID